MKIEISETEKSWPLTVHVDDDNYIVVRDPKTGHVELDKEQALQLAAALYHFANKGGLPE